MFRALICLPKGNLRTKSIHFLGVDLRTGFGEGEGEGAKKSYHFFFAEKDFESITSFIDTYPFKKSELFAKNNLI